MPVAQEGGWPFCRPMPYPKTGRPKQEATNATSQEAFKGIFSFLVTLRHRKEKGIALSREKANTAREAASAPPAPAGEGG